MQYCIFGLNVGESLVFQFSVNKKYNVKIHGSFKNNHFKTQPKDDATFYENSEAAKYLTA